MGTTAKHATAQLGTLGALLAGLQHMALLSPEASTYATISVCIFMPSDEEAAQAAADTCAMHPELLMQRDTQPGPGLQPTWRAVADGKGALPSVTITYMGPVRM